MEKQDTTDFEDSGEVTHAGIVSRVADLMERVVRLVTIALFAAMIAVVMLEVVARYAFGSPTYWTEIVARYAMVWMVLLGMAVGVRHREHIRVDGLVDIAPRTLQVVLAVLRIVISLAFGAVLLCFGYELAVMNMAQRSGAIGMPVFYLYLAVPVAAAMMVLFLTELIAKREIRPF